MPVGDVDVLEIEVDVQWRFDALKNAIKLVPKKETPISKPYLPRVVTNYRVAEITIFKPLNIVNYYLES